jgi:deoxyribodipyrimidine photo-lyase
MYQNTLFIFRQDLRTYDNTGLIKAITDSQTVLPIFIFDTTILAQLPPRDKRLHFIMQALKALDHQLRAINSHLTIYHGDPKQIIPQLVTQYTIDAIYRNESYGHGAISRDTWLQDRCRKHAIACHASHDFLLVPIDYTPARKVFTPFYKLRQTYFDHNPVVVQQTIPETSTPQTEGLSRAGLEKLLDIQSINDEKNI